MEKNLRIFGFLDTKGYKFSGCIVIVLISKSDDFEIVYPDRTKRKVAPTTKERVRLMRSFIPLEDESLSWVEGQTAYLDRYGKVRIGTSPELLEVVKDDLASTDCPKVIQYLKDLVKELEKDIEKNPSG